MLAASVQLLFSSLLFLNILLGEKWPAIPPNLISNNLNFDNLVFGLLIPQEFLSSGLVFEYSGNGNKPTSSPSRVVRAHSLLSWQVMRPASLTAGRHIQNTKDIRTSTTLRQWAKPRAFSPNSFSDSSCVAYITTHFVQREFSWSLFAMPCGRAWVLS